MDDKEEKKEETKDEKTVNMDDDEKDTGKKEIKKRKGVGYDDGGVGSKWNTNDWLAQQQFKNEQIMSLVNILKSMLCSASWKPDQSILRIFCESCVLCLLENALRCSSLLEMAKQKDLYIIFLDLVQTISKISHLVPALLPIDNRYQPKQYESIYSLLTKRAEGAELFIKIGGEKNTSEDAADDLETNKAGFELSKHFIKVFQEVKAVVESSDAFNQMNEVDESAIMSLPLEDLYPTLLKRHLFGYANFKVPAKNKNDKEDYDHHWKSNFLTAAEPGTKKLVRMA